MATDFLAGDGISTRLDYVKLLLTIVLRSQRYIEIEATKLPSGFGGFFVFLCCNRSTTSCVTIKGYVKRLVNENE